MTFLAQLQRHEAYFHLSLVIDTPPSCLEVIELARRDGIRVRTLYVLRELLFLYRRGSCDLEQRDIWILLRADDDDDGLEQALRTLLHELSHLDSTVSGEFKTIDEDWDEEVRTWKHAHALAQRWGMETVLPLLVVQEHIDYCEHMRESHWEAGNLAGSHRPHIARTAYDALCQLAQQRHWTGEYLFSVLSGIADQDEDQALLVGFDRCLLRSSWMLPYGHGRGDFGALAQPKTKESTQFLRHVLASVTSGVYRSQVSTWKYQETRKRHFGFFQIEDANSFTQVLVRVNEILLDHAELSARVYWWVYTSEPSVSLPHIYRLSLEFDISFQDEQDDGFVFPEYEVWLLFPSSTYALFETAWQQYVLSWRKHTSICEETLDDGLRLLWHKMQAY